MVSGSAGTVVTALVIAAIVGFVTASIKSYVDRIFLVLLAVFLLRLPLTQAIVVNLLVVFLAGVFFFARNESALAKIPQSVAWATVSTSFVAAAIGRAVGLTTSPGLLAVLLGIYAIGVALRLALVKVVPPAETTPPHAGLAWLNGLFGFLTGLLSAGGKPFLVPAFVKIHKLHPGVAYLLSSVAVLGASMGALGAQIILAPQALVAVNFIWAVYFYIAITGVALLVERVWTPGLQKGVTYAIIPLLIVAGIKLILMA